MNVRIENQNLRFKISEEELEVLLDGYPVHAKVRLLDKTFVVAVNPLGRGETMAPKLVLDSCEAYLNLLIPCSIVKALSDMGQNREGVKQQVGGVSVSLQVDMRGACHA